MNTWSARTCSTSTATALCLSTRRLNKSLTFAASLSRCSFFIPIVLILLVLEGLGIGLDCQHSPCASPTNCHSKVCCCPRFSKKIVRIIFSFPFTFSLQIPSSFPLASNLPQYGEKDFDLLTTTIAKGTQISWLLWLGFVNLFHDKYQWETWKDTAGKSARLK